LQKLKVVLELAFDEPFDGNGLVNAMGNKGGWVERLVSFWMRWLGIARNIQERILKLAR
jgi:hypothetical protein